MKKLTFLFLIFISTLSICFAFPCNRYTKPKAVKTIKDYDIISSHTAIISTDFAFTGHQLIYSVAADPKNKKNIVRMNSHTGKVRIDANAKDQFDIKVVAKNPCGIASTKFNVQIDEEN